MKDEDGNELKDGRHVIFIDADYSGDWRLKKLMEDLKQTDPEKMNYSVLKERARYFKEEEVGIMYLNADLQKMVDDNRAAERAIARKEKETEMVQGMLQANIPVETISQIAKITKEEVLKIKKEM